MKNKTRLYYDEEGDFLEISIGEPVECYAQEIEPGVFMRISKNEGDVRSISILDFRKRAHLRDIEFNLPLVFNFKQLKKDN